MSQKRNTIIAWVLFGLITASVMAGIVLKLSTLPTGDKPALGELVFPLVPLAFAFVGALILSYQPQNRIGWLMILPGASFSVLVDAYLKQFPAAPQSPSLLFLIILWYSNWNWLLLVFPILFILVLFPGGKALSRRWGWLIFIGLGMCAILILLSIFYKDLAPGSGLTTWSVRNPIGFISAEWAETYFLAPWLFSLPVLTFFCAASLLARFRRARGVEREQVKWLMFGGVIFAAFYIPFFIDAGWSQASSIFDILFSIGMLCIPGSIAIAILRYRLFDIDIIIRRTLQYTLISGLLALVYFGAVTVLQSIFTAVSGQKSAASLVLSTLVIAALFNPLRRRVQDFIDRRFYRQKYDAEKALSAFAEAARRETELEALTTRLTATVQETLQPEYASLWMKSSAKKIARSEGGHR